MLEAACQRLDPAGAGHAVGVRERDRVAARGGHAEVARERAVAPWRSDDDAPAASATAAVSSRRGGVHDDELVVDGLRLPSASRRRGRSAAAFQAGTTTEITPSRLGWTVSEREMAIALVRAHGRSDAGAQGRGPRLAPRSTSIACSTCWRLQRVVSDPRRSPGRRPRDRAPGRVAERIRATRMRARQRGLLDLAVTKPDRARPRRAGHRGDAAQGRDARRDRLRRHRRAPVAPTSTCSCHLPDLDRRRGGRRAPRLARAGAPAQGGHAVAPPRAVPRRIRPRSSSTGASTGTRTSFADAAMARADRTETAGCARSRRTRSPSCCSSSRATASRGFADVAATWPPGGRLSAGPSETAAGVRAIADAHPALAPAPDRGRAGTPSDAGDLPKDSLAGDASPSRRRARGDPAGEPVAHGDRARRSRPRCRSRTLCWRRAVGSPAMSAASS